MRQSTILLFLALLGTSSFSAGGSPTIWTGVLSGESIVWRAVDQAKSVENDTPLADPAIAAQYFYRAHGKYITLRDRGDGWLLECTTTFRETNCDKPSGMWRIVSRSNAEIAALWKESQSAATTALILNPDKVQGEDAWEKLLGEGPRQTSPTIHKGGVSYTVMNDPRSGAKVPLLVDGLPEDAISRFNNLRRAELIQTTAEWLDNQSYGGDDSAEDSVLFVSRRLMTWAGGQGGYYGGAHPLWAWSVVTYDLSTGKAVDARDLFRSALPQIQGKGDSLVVDMTVEPDTLEALVLRQAHALRRAHALAAQRDVTAPESSSPAADCFDDWFGSIADCDVDESGELAACTLQILRWSNGVEVRGMIPMLTFAGLAVVSNDTDEVSRACRGVMITIPWDEAKPVLAPGIQLP